MVFIVVLQFCYIIVVSVIINHPGKRVTRVYVTVSQSVAHPIGEANWVGHSSVTSVQFGLSVSSG